MGECACIFVQQLTSNQCENSNVNDWVIDAKGDMTIYWCLASIGSQYYLDKKMRVLNHINGSGTLHSHLFNLTDTHSSNINHVINALFDDEYDKAVIFGVLSQINSYNHLHDLLNKITFMPSNILPNENKSKIEEILNTAIKLNIFDIVGDTSEKAWDSHDLFDSNSLNLVLLPCLEKNPDNIKFLLDFYIKLLIEKIKNKNDEKFRITLLGLSGREDNIPGFIKKLKECNNVELIISSSYPVIDGNKYNQVIKEFSQTMCLCSHNVIPEQVHCLESSIRNLSFGEAIILNKGKYDGSISRMPYLDIKDANKISLFHANGESFS